MNERSDRIRAALQRHIASTNEAAAALQHVMQVQPENTDMTTAATADGGLLFIRTLQDIADILDEAPAQVNLAEDDDAIRDAVVTLAMVMLSRDLAITTEAGLSRPFRRALSRVFPNELIRKLKAIKEGTPEPDCDA